MDRIQDQAYTIDPFLNNDNNERESLVQPELLKQNRYKYEL